MNVHTGKMRGKLQPSVILSAKAQIVQNLKVYFFMQGLLLKHYLIMWALHRTRAASVKTKQNNTKERSPPFFSFFGKRGCTNSSNFQRYKHTKTSFSRCRLQTQVEHPALEAPIKWRLSKQQQGQKNYYMCKYFHCLPVLLFITFFTSFQVFLADFTAKFGWILDRVQVDKWLYLGIAILTY